MEFYQTKKLENNKTNQNSEETAYKTEYVLTIYPIVTIQIKTKLKNRIKDLSRLFPPKYPNDQQVYENFLKTTNYQQKSERYYTTLVTMIHLKLDSNCCQGDGEEKTLVSLSVKV